MFFAPSHEVCVCSDANAWDMTNDELDQWDAFLRLTMDRALDYGVDSISVVDHVASIIAPHGSLSLLSSTRISDLLLSHFDIADARTIPHALCELVNDTLDGAYPPSEHNKLPTIWLLRTLTRTLDACPVELIEQLLECVQDGLRRWVSDESEVLTEQEYSLDIVPVYQTATVIIMSMPAKNATVEKFAGLLHSAFTGREEAQETMVQAFRDLWESTYTKVAAPAEGWSEKIVACLQQAGLMPTEAETESSDAEEVEDQLLSAPLSDDAALSPVVSSPSTLAAPFTLSSPTRRPQFELPFPTTPTTCGRRTVTPPPRPHKTSSPVRPLAPLLFFESPSKSPVTPKKRTPGSSLLKADKENASPLHLIPSVTERIALRSPMAVSSSILGKRALELDPEEPLPESVKRVCKDLPRPLSIAPFLEPPAKPTSVLSGSNPRKRKGIFLEAVEVPTLREVMRKAVSFDPSASSSSNKLVVPLRKTRSVGRLESSSSSGSDAKRRRTEALPEPSYGSSDDDVAQWQSAEEQNSDGCSVSSSLTSPVRNLREMQTMGSGKYFLCYPRRPRAEAFSFV